jgi:hypothetical protein
MLVYSRNPSPANWRFCSRFEPPGVGEEGEVLRPPLDESVEGELDHGQGVNTHFSEQLEHYASRLGVLCSYLES